DPLRAGLELLPLLEAPVDFLAGADGDVVAVVRLADSDVDLPAMACPADMLGQRNNRRAQFAKGPFLPVGGAVRLHVPAQRNVFLERAVQESNEYAGEDGARLQDQRILLRTGERGRRTVDDAHVPPRRIG